MSNQTGYSGSFGVGIDGPLGSSHGRVNSIEGGQRFSDFNSSYKHSTEKKGGRAGKHLMNTPNGFQMAKDMNEKLLSTTTNKKTHFSRQNPENATYASERRGSIDQRPIEETPTEFNRSYAEDSFTKQSNRIGDSHIQARHSEI